MASRLRCRSCFRRRMERLPEQMVQGPGHHPSGRRYLSRCQAYVQGGGSGRIHRPQLPDDQPLFTDGFHATAEEVIRFPAGDFSQAGGQFFQTDMGESSPGWPDGLPAHPVIPLLSGLRHDSVQPVPLWSSQSHHVERKHRQSDLAGPEDHPNRKGAYDQKEGPGEHVGIITSQSWGG